ncbi:MAG: peptidylprolyl isomerase, partial [Deferribacterales bacterium]|nr:peptidylprolyl isomerase [Deferribacterales bacterium]
KSKYDIDEELKEEIAEKIRNKRYEKVYMRWFENQKKSIFVKYMN